MPHRGESRGVGGIFFDQLHEVNSGLDKTQLFNYCIDLGKLFPVVYKAQIDAVTTTAPSAEEMNWQALRRGRYVEFNLVHDKGTLFGLKTNGRIESILMSLPPAVQWHYNFQPAPGSEEARLLEVLSSPKDWVT